MTDGELRFTIDQVDFSQPIESWKPRVADRGRRRYLSYTLDFDTRAVLLEQELAPDWGEEAVRRHTENREHLRQGLGAQFGEQALERKVADFVAIKSKPFSVLAYHNQFFEQVRAAFVLGAYYPALVGACALGERILNHLILDLRAAYSGTPEFKRVSRKDSFDDWRVPIDTLEAWEVLVSEAASEFRSLMVLRHRSIHFNISTYASHATRVFHNGRSGRQFRNTDPHLVARGRDGRERSQACSRSRRPPMGTQPG